MRQVVGKATRELTPEAFADLRGSYDGLLLDLGTGDGKHVVSVARARPRTLVVGLDAGPDAMRPTAAKAARKPAKGGLPNAVFVWAAIEALPGLDGVTEVHSLMPWGSLLRALVAPEARVLRTIAAACVTGAGFLLTLNLHAWRPPVPEVGGTAEPTPSLDELRPRYAEAGWTVDDAHYADAEEITALGTSWTKRLGSTREELAVLVVRGRITA